MDIGKSFTFMFEDPQWVAKLAIGGAILLAGTLFSWLLLITLIVAGALVLGYSLQVTRNVAEGSAMPLPEWNDFSTLLVKGLTAIVGSIVWLLPVIILGCCVGLANATLSGAAAGNSDAARNASGVAALVSACLSCLLAVVSIILGITLYAPLTRFALNGQVNTFWDFTGNWRFIQLNAGNYIIAVILYAVASFVAGFGIIACVIGAFFTSFWAYLVGSYLFGQVARTAGMGMMVPPGGTMPPVTPPPAEPPMPA